MRANFIFKQDLVQQAENEDLETRVTTNEFAHLDQLAKDLDKETKVNQSKRKSKKLNQVGDKTRSTILTFITSGHH